MNNLSSDFKEVTSTAYPFFPMDLFLATNYVICNVIGLPLNVLTAIYIVLTPRLHQTRNIIWLGVAFSNVLVLSEHLVEFHAYQFQSDTAKKIFSLVAGLPYGSLMMNLFLLLTDRYVSIAHSDWYKRKVTITWIVSGQIALFSIICVLMKGPYLLEIFPFPPRITTTELKLFSVTGFFTLILCVFGQIFVYAKIKCFLRLEKDMDISPSTNRRIYNRKGKNTHQTTEFMGEELPEAEQENSLDHFHCHQTATPSRKNTAVTTSPHFIQIGNEVISRLELKAARHALDSVTLLLVFALPTYATFMCAITADCSPATTHLISQDCSTYLWTFAYTRGISLLYVVVNPIFFTIRSHDLVQALNRSG